MQIEERVIGDVTVLELDGSITYGAASAVLHERVDRLLTQGRTKIVLGMGKVPYIDSAGLGEIVRTYKTVTRIGGKVVFYALTKRMDDLLSGPAKLTSILELGNTIEEALALFDPSGLNVSCPVCPGEHAVPFTRTTVSYLSQKCPACNTKFGVKLEEHFSTQDVGRDGVVVPVTFLALPTYENEFVQVAFTTPVEIKLHGRLDLFAAETAEKAWQLVPPPRRVVFSMGYPNTDFTERGLATVLALCDRWADDERAVFEASFGLSPEFVKALPTDRRVHQSSQSASQALGGVEVTRPLSVRIRRSGGPQS
jgi:anti-anti-sigma factor